MFSRLKRHSALIVAVSFAATFFLLSVAMPAMGGPKAFAAIKVSTINKRLNKARKDIKVVSRRQKKDAANIRTVTTTANTALATANAAAAAAGSGTTTTPPPQTSTGPAQGGIIAKVSFRSLNAAPPATFYNTGKFALRGSATAAAT